MISLLLLLEFEKFEGKGVSLIKFKLIYLMINLIILSIMLYKFYNMGLLPLNPSDYTELIPKSKVITKIDNTNFHHSNFPPFIS